MICDEFHGKWLLYININTSTLQLLAAQVNFGFVGFYLRYSRSLVLEAPAGKVLRFKLDYSKSSCKKGTQSFEFYPSKQPLHIHWRHIVNIWLLCAKTICLLKVNNRIEKSNKNLQNIIKWHLIIKLPSPNIGPMHASVKNQIKVCFLLLMLPLVLVHRHIWTGDEQRWTFFVSKTGSNQLAHEFFLTFHFV